MLVDGAHLYATDIIAQHRIVKMRMDGTIIKSTGRGGNAPGFPKWHSTSKDGEIYVCDGGTNHKVQVFGRDLHLVRVFGGNGFLLIWILTKLATSTLLKKVTIEFSTDSPRRSCLQRGF